MSPSTSDSSPTPAQLRYLRALAEQTGTTFVSPRTRGQASREIDRLRQLKVRTPAPPPDEEEAELEQLVYATAVQPGEVSGFGANCQWSNSSPVMSTAPKESRVGQRTELARYELSSGERVLYGQRINGCVRITDRPASGPGRSYLVGQYAALDTGQTREIVSLQRPDGSTLVIDCLAGTLADARLLAHLAPEEPAKNADIVAGIYLADETRGRCRRLTPQDLRPARHANSPRQNDGTVSQRTSLRDANGHIYRIRELATAGSVSELRWTRSCHPGREDPFETVRLRNVVGSLEDYEPALTVTADALAGHRERCGASVGRLGAELERLARSPIVLNRGLREAVQGKLARGELSMSEIAMRCGRMKRDTRGNWSGETSWLARRIGQRPEGGEDQPTPWVHSDVLALIARQGLATNPNEVEV
jgi:hypothetical protein